MRGKKERKPNCTMCRLVVMLGGARKADWGEDDGIEIKYVHNGRRRDEWYDKTAGGKNSQMLCNWLRIRAAGGREIILKERRLQSRKSRLAEREE